MERLCDPKGAAWGLFLWLCALAAGCAPPANPRGQPVEVSDLRALCQLNETDPAGFAAAYGKRPLEFTLRVDEMTLEPRGTLTLVQKDPDPKPPLEIWVQDVANGSDLKRGDVIKVRGVFRRVVERKIFLEYGEVVR